MKDDFPDDRYRISRKGFNIEKDHRQIEQKAVKTRLRLYHLGQGTTYDDIRKVLDALTKRDYPDLDVFDGLKKLQIFIPDQLLTASPQIIGEVQYQEIRNTLQQHDKKLLKKYEGYHDSLKGYIVEYECHEAIKSYFLGKDESVLVIHSLNLEPLETTGFKKLSKEKDFVIVNYTHCYIMVVEVKRTLRCNCDDPNAKSETCPERKSARQILGAYQVLQNLFGADIDEFWWFIPVTFCWTYEECLEQVQDKMIINRGLRAISSWVVTIFYQGVHEEASREGDSLLSSNSRGGFSFSEVA